MVIQAQNYKTMKNNKTLKDIIEDIEPLGDVVNPRILKIEAIKWLKEDKKVIERLHPDDVSTWTISMRRWMKRFNISEEDLKEISEEGYKL